MQISHEHAHRAHFTRPMRWLDAGVDVVLIQEGMQFNFPGIKFVTGSQPSSERKSSAEGSNVLKTKQPGPLAGLHWSRNCWARDEQAAQHPKSASAEWVWYLGTQEGMQQTALHAFAAASWQHLPWRQGLKLQLFWESSAGAPVEGWEDSLAKMVVLESALQKSCEYHEVHIITVHILNCLTQWTSWQ